tara:strand:+ start:429 stop:920 length:492 start_codon:yes stop_codon:yes gene_type:complete
MNVASLLRKKSFREIFNFINKYYLYDKNKSEKESYSVNFLKSYDELISLQFPKSSMKICLDIEPCDGDVVVTIVSGEEEFACDFVSWEEILGCEIITKHGKKFSEIEIISHILWEITFWGFSRKQLMHNKNKLLESLNDTDNLEVCSIEDFIKEIKEQENDGK